MVCSSVSHLLSYTYGTYDGRSDVFLLKRWFSAQIHSYFDGRTIVHLGILSTLCVAWTHFIARPYNSSSIGVIALHIFTKCFSENLHLPFVISVLELPSKSRIRYNTPNHILYWRSNLDSFSSFPTTEPVRTEVGSLLKAVTSYCIPIKRSLRLTRSKYALVLGDLSVSLSSDVLQPERVAHVVEGV
ncbi:hypothetical protein U1Q18_050060 [Sarracenia purpurea var. burkii]